MSSVSPIGQQPVAVSGLTPTTEASAPPAPYLNGTLDGIAGMLSMPTQTLRNELKQGSSISDIASQNGVSRSSILNYIEQQVQQRRAAQGKPPIDAQTLQQVASRAIDRHRHARGGLDAVQPQSQPTQPSTQSSSSAAALDLLA